MQNAIAARRQQINENFVQRNLRNAFTGDMSAVKDTVLEKIFAPYVLYSEGAPAPSALFTGESGETVAVLTTAQFQCKLNASGTYAVFAPTANGTGTYDDIMKSTGTPVWRIAYMDANNTNYLSQAMRSFLNRMRILYSILEDTNYRKYLAGNASQDGALVVDTYYDGTTPTRSFSGLTLKDDLHQFLDEKGVTPLFDIRRVDLNKTNLFSVRRLCLLYETLCYMHLAMYALDRASSPSGAALSPDLVNSLLATLTKLNMNVMDTSGPGSLNKSLQRRISRYNKNVQTINEMDTQVRDLKMFLTGESERLVENQGTAKRTYVYEVLAFVAVAITGLVGAALMWMPMERRTQVQGAGMLFASAVLVATISRMVYKKRVEGFQTAVSATLPTPGYLGYGITASNKIALMGAVNRTWMDSVAEYLANTVFMSLALATFRTYGTAGYSVQKEVRYYRDKTVQMENSGYKLRQGTAVTRLEQKGYAATFTFLMTLTVIIAATVGALIAAKEYVFLHRWIYAVAIACVLLATFVYMFEIVFRVRTDGAKFYWGQPNTSSL